MSKKKITVTAPVELFDWCSEISEQYGVSVPSLFLVAMMEYKNRFEGIKDFNKSEQKKN